MERTKQPVSKFFSRLHTLEAAINSTVLFYSPLTEQEQLLSGCELNQPRFFNFLFNLFDVYAGNGFADEKNLHLTTYAHRKCCMWKSSGQRFEIYDLLR